MKKIRILLSGGGSGGHIYPLIAVGEALQIWSAGSGYNLELRYIGSPKQYDLKLLAAGIKVKKIAESKLRRYFSLLVFWDLIKFLWSVPQAFWRVFWFMPDIVFSKGGPGSLPVLYACRFYKIPVVIHESDAIPSLTTRLAAKFAVKVLLAFESSAEYLENAKSTMIVGNPIRNELNLGPGELTVEGLATAKKILDFAEDKPLILVLGGSQGAKTINDFILKYLPFLIEKYQMLHQVGLKNYAEHHSLAEMVLAGVGERQRKNYHDVSFLETQMRAALIAADLVISRAGSGAIFEIAAAGKPSILIPLEDSAGDHQNENAFQYEASGACVVLKEENMANPAVVTHLINSLLGDPERLKKMSENAKIFAKLDSAQDIIRVLMSILGL